MYVHICATEAHFFFFFSGQPPPRVTWWRENFLLDESYGVVPERRVQNVLKLESLKREHLKAVFLCMAGNSNLSSPISSTVTLDMNREYFFHYIEKK